MSKARRMTAAAALIAISAASIVLATGTRVAGVGEVTQPGDGSSAASADAIAGPTAGWAGGPAAATNRASRDRRLTDLRGLMGLTDNVTSAPTPSSPHPVEGNAGVAGTTGASETGGPGSVGTASTATITRTPRPAAKSGAAGPTAGDPAATRGGTPTGTDTATVVAGGRSYDAPAGAVAVAPGESAQAVVDRHPAGTVYVLGSGTHTNQTITPKSGDTFMGAGGTVLDGSGVTEDAFRGSATDVTIRGLVVQHYAPSTAPNAAINPDPGNGAARWLIEDVEARYNFPGAGIKLADQSTIRNSSIHHNGKVGITAWRVSGALIEGSEIAYNNWDPGNPGSSTGLHDYLWDAGGAKFVSTTDLVLRRNDVHHNLGTGLWCDIDCRHTVIEGNRLHDNAAAGIFYEISYGATIRDNAVTRNGLTGTHHSPGFFGAGILVSESRDVEVYGNVVAGNQAGLVGKQDRTEGRGEAPYGPYVLENLYVHHNDITSLEGTSGVVQYMGDLSYFSSRNIRFDANTYRGTTSHWWDEQTLAPANWQAAGLDVNGRWL